MNKIMTRTRARAYCSRNPLPGFPRRSSGPALDWRSTPARLDDEAVRLAVLAAMAESIFLREALFLRLGGEMFADLALLLDNHVAAFGYAEGLLREVQDDRTSCRADA